MSQTEEHMESAAPFVALMQMTTGSWVSQAIYVVAELGIADLLTRGPTSCRELAAVVNTHPTALYRVLRALASVGVFAELDDGRFCLTPAAEYLRSDVPNSLCALATMVGREWHWKLVGELLRSVQTGQPSFDRVFGMSQFEFLAKSVEDGAVFNQAMTNFSIAEVPAVIEAYDFSRFQKLVDVGGGHGSLVLSVLENTPTLTAVLYEVPLVARSAREIIGQEPVGDRCEIAEGDFLESAPRGGDAYMMKHILHDWDDDRSLKILENCRDAMAPNTTLLVIEMVIPPGNDPFVGKLLDLEMLLIGGCERTESQYRALFEAAGFRLTRVIPTHSQISIVEGVRV